MDMFASLICDFFPTHKCAALIDLLVQRLQELVGRIPTQGSFDYGIIRILPGD
jgi:hypothetical protein